MLNQGGSISGINGSSAATTSKPQLDTALCLRLTGFVSFLRENGFALGIDDATLLVESAGHIGVFAQTLLRWSPRGAPCRRAADRQRFDSLFDSWFLVPNKRQYVESRGAGRGTLDR